MSHSDAWSNPASTSPEDIARMAKHLEQSARRPDQAQVNLAVRAALNPQPGERVLDVGCGSGVIGRLFVPSLSPGGWLVGLDASQQFTRIAKQLAEKHDGETLQIFHTGKAERLPYRNQLFDGAWALRLLMHANEPDTVVREMKRVLKPGGRMVLADWDFDTTAVDHSDRALTRRILHWRNDFKGGDNWSGRQLLRRARSGGLVNIKIEPIAVTAVDERAALTQSLFRAAEAALQANAIRTDEYETWTTELRERLDSRSFFASILYFIVKGWKPQHGS